MSLLWSSWSVRESARGRHDCRHVDIVERDLGGACGYALFAGHLRNGPPHGAGAAYPQAHLIIRAGSAIDTDSMGVARLCAADCCRPVPNDVAPELFLCGLRSGYLVSGKTATIRTALETFVSAKACLPGSVCDARVN